MWKIKYYDVKISLLWSDYQCYRPILFVLVPEEDFQLWNRDSMANTPHICSSERVGGNHGKLIIVIPLNSLTIHFESCTYDFKCNGLVSVKIIIFKL